MNNLIQVFIQARMGSSRLAGKILKDLSGKPLLLHVYERLTYSHLVNKIVVATTDQPGDDIVEKFCNANNILYYRGNSDNVLSRFYETAKHFEAKIIIRITADCPVIDPVILDKMITEFLIQHKNEKLDYMSNSIKRTFPRGLDIEIFTFSALEKAYKEATKNYEREHVTPYIYQNPKKFKIQNFADEIDYSFYRWTVDTKEDFRLMEEIYNALYSTERIFLYPEILNLFKERHELIDINRSVEQKKLGE